MPSKTLKQHNFFGKAYSDPKFAKAHGVSKSVAEDFLKADKGKKFKKKKKK